MSTKCEKTGFSVKQQERWPFLHKLLIDESDIYDESVINSEITDKLSKDIHDFTSKQKISKDILDRKKGLIKHLKRRFDMKFRGSKLTTFGSSESGLGLQNGDVDLCLEFKGEKPKKVLTKIARMLRDDGMDEVTLISHAKVPIVKFIDKRSRIPIDISINNSLALYNTKLLKSYSECDQRVRPFILAIKHWALHRGICNAAYGTFSSYAWTLIALQNLQITQPPVIPNIQQAENRELTNIDGEEYDLTMHPNPSKLIDELNNNNIGLLVAEFFELFATNWPWDENIISIRSGKMLSRKEKKWKEQKPKVFDAILDEEIQRLGKHSLPVEDPFDTMHDLSRVLRPEGVLEIRDEFLRAWNILKDGGDWKKLTETKFPELITDKPNTDLFEDLRLLPEQEIISKLDNLRKDLEQLDSELELRKIERNNAIEMSKALRKNAELSKEESKLANSLRPRREKMEQVKKQRDTVNNNYIPVHWIEDEMSKVYKRLTEDVDTMRIPSLEKEKELFSWFFELQSMHQHSKETRNLHNEFIKLLDEQKNALSQLGSVKEQDRIDDSFGRYSDFDDLAHKLLLEMNPMHNQRRVFRREIGRLEAWMRISKQNNNKKAGSRKGGKNNFNRKSRRKNKFNSEEVKSRAASGESLSLSDLDILLNSGGLSSISSSKDDSRDKKKKKSKNRVVSPQRGTRGRSKKGI